MVMNTKKTYQNSIQIIKYSGLSIQGTPLRLEIEVFAE